MIGTIYLLGGLVFGTLLYVIGEFFETKGKDFFGSNSVVEKIAMCAGVSCLWPILVPGAIIVLAVLGLYNFFKKHLTKFFEKTYNKYFGVKPTETIENTKVKQKNNCN